jgi:dTDP-4-dehydrorhamnose reductase
MRLLVFGGWGQLGTELAGVAEGRHELIRPRHADVDVRDRRAVEEVVAANLPDVVVNAAAFHKVERCEEEPETAFAVNAVGAASVARAAAAAGARSVFVSSDYVFGGDEPKGYEEDDPTGPLNVYGVSKATGEWMVRLSPLDSLVMRGSALFGHAGSSGKGGNFVETIMARAAAGEPLSVADDIVMSPTAARDMAERMLLLLEREAPAGVYHVANAGGCSWYEFARAIVDAGGYPVEVAPRSSAEDSIRRPSCSVLVDTKSADLGLPPARPWREALEWYVANRAEGAPVAEGAR